MDVVKLCRICLDLLIYRVSGKPAGIFHVKSNSGTRNWREIWICKQWFSLFFPMHLKTAIAWRCKSCKLTSQPPSIMWPVAFIPAKLSHLTSISFPPDCWGWRWRRRWHSPCWRRTFLQPWNCGEPSSGHDDKQQETNQLLWPLWKPGKW